MRKNKILIIAGLDPTGNAGCIVDTAVCRYFKKGFFLITTALTAQDDAVFDSFSATPVKHIKKLQALISKQKFLAIKIGMLATPKIVHRVCKIIQSVKKKSPKVNVVWDPVFTSSSRGQLADKATQRLALNKLLPLVDVITPNWPEAYNLLHLKQTSKALPREICQKLFTRYHKIIYLKGGHSKNPATDHLFDGKKYYCLTGKLSKTSRRGTGCLFSTALACNLDKSLLTACQKSKKFVGDMIDCHLRLQISY